jgi:hypothetical protein
MELDKLHEALEENKLPIGTPFEWLSQTGKFIVRVMHIGSGKFIFLADDGVHGTGRVLNSSKFNKHNGELYEVDGLEWTGSKYRAVGNVQYIGNIADLYQQFNEK